MSYQAAVQSVASVGLGLQVLLAVVLVAKRTWEKFPVFTAYALLNLLENLILYALARRAEAYFYAYIVGETITILLGLAVFYEIFVHLFSLYPALRRVARLSLVLSVLLLLSVGGAVLQAHIPIGKSGVAQTVVAVEEAARVLEVGLIAFLFVFSGLFGLHWRQSVFGVTLGLGIYTVGKLLVLTMSPHIGQALNLAQMLGFDCSILVWLGYILAPERVISTAELPKRAQLEQWNQAIMELINQ